MLEKLYKIMIVIILINHYYYSVLSCDTSPREHAIFGTRYKTFITSFCRRQCLDFGTAVPVAVLEPVENPGRRLYNYGTAWDSIVISADGDCFRTGYSQRRRY